MPGAPEKADSCKHSEFLGEALGQEASRHSQNSNLSAWRGGGCSSTSGHTGSYNLRTGKRGWGVGGQLEQCQHLHFPQLELTRINMTKQQSKALRDEGGVLSESTFQHGCSPSDVGGKEGTCFGQVPRSIISIRLCTLMLLCVFLGSTIAKCHRQAARTQTLSQEPLPLAGGSVSSHLHTVKGDSEPSRSLS